MHLPNGVSVSLPTRKEAYQKSMSTDAAVWWVKVAAVVSNAFILFTFMTPRAAFPFDEPTITHESLALITLLWVCLRSCKFT